MEIKITNKIEQKVNEYQERTGATKTWIASQLGISKARLYQVCQADNMMLDVALRFALFLGCEISDLFDYEFVGEDKNSI